MRSLAITAGLGLVLSVVLTSVATAQPRELGELVLWSAAASDLRALERSALGVAGRALPSARRVESTCDPSDDGCVRSILPSAGVAHLLVIRAHWRRGACVPIRGADGARTGSRMLRVRVVELVLYASDGTVIDRRAVEVASETDVAPIEAALAELLGA